MRVPQVPPAALQFGVLGAEACGCHELRRREVIVKTLPTTLPGVVLLELVAHSDERGRVIETYHRERYASAGVAVGMDFVQDNRSTSVAGVLRGLHLQLRHRQGKLVHVLRGSIFDVAVDVRRGSPTYGRWFGTELSAANRRQLWIPPGFAHGFQVLTEADVIYKLTAPYSPSDERAVRWDDPTLAISWPGTYPHVISDRDRRAPLLADADLPGFEP